VTSAATQLGEQARSLLRRGPLPPRELIAALGVSQPTLSRALRTLGDDLVPLGAARSIQYALRDASRLPLMAPVYRASADGQLNELGTLIPVCPDGFVMAQRDGIRLYSAGLPWWLHDMRPQGYLGRAYIHQHGSQLGLPSRLNDWNDSHVLRALLEQGSDLPGNLLIGQAARDLFVNTAPPQPLPMKGKAQAYARLAAAAARGEHHGSSAGGEQPKFTAYVHTPERPAHVIVKFTAQTDTPVSERWRDLLQAEHLALEVLRDHGVAAARSALYNRESQRFLEVQRFDRAGPLGRRALLSMAALDAEFVGRGSRWPQVVRALANERIVTSESVAIVDVLWAFGVLTGNTDMHLGNLSFVSEHGRPYQVAPAYDMTCMAFAPTTGGEIPDRKLALDVSGDVSAMAWKQALVMASDLLARLQGCNVLSERFRPCIAVLAAHLSEAGKRIARLTG